MIRKRKDQEIILGLPFQVHKSYYNTNRTHFQENHLSLMNILFT